MKRLKNILLVIALLVLAMPCTHAADHHHASPFSELPDQMTGVHTCECHSCDSDTVCTEPLEMPQELTFSTAAVLAPASLLQLFVLNQSRSVFTTAAPPVHGPLPGHKTTQLLI